MTHGIYRQEQPPDVRAIGDVESGIVSDKGGIDATSTLLRTSIVDYANLTVLGNRMLQHIVATMSQESALKQRPVPPRRRDVELYLRIVDRKLRLGLAIGFERDARRLNPLERLRQQMNPDSADRSDDAAAAQPARYARPADDVTQEAADA